MLYTAPKTVTKTTTKLSAGDVVLTGNCVLGFGQMKIVSVEAARKPRQALVTVEFLHGGKVTTVEGKTTRWDVIVQEAN